MHPDRTRKLHNVHIQTRQQQNYTNDKDSHLFCGEKQFTRVYSSSRTHRRDEALLDYVAEEYGGSVELTVGVPYCGKPVAQHAREDVTLALVARVLEALQHRQHLLVVVSGGVVVTSNRQQQRTIINHVLLNVRTHSH